MLDSLSTTTESRAPATGPSVSDLFCDDESSTVSELSRERLGRIKFAYTTRAVADLVAREEQTFSLLEGTAVQPEAGDIVIARVVELGHHKRLESPVSRRVSLFVGDEIAIAYGNRYASDQFHAAVPNDLGTCHLVAAGGVAARVIERHTGIGSATVLEPVGLLCTGRGRVTLASVSTHDLLELPDSSREFSDRAAARGVASGAVIDDAAAYQGAATRPHVIAVVGASMNSGKTTTAACLIRGLTEAGHTVGAGKVTGTGAGNDPGFYRDAGAHHTLDFTDYGFPTTFQIDFDHIRRLLASQVEDLAGRGAGVVVVEVADGLYQAETRRLLEDPVFHGYVDQVVFAAGDALGAAAGTQLLREHNVHPATVTGLLTASPLAAEEARAVLDVPVTSTFELTDPRVARQLFAPEAA